MLNSLLNAKLSSFSFFNLELVFPLDQFYFVTACHLQAWPLYIKKLFQEYCLYAVKSIGVLKVRIEEG